MAQENWQKYIVICIEITSYNDLAYSVFIEQNEYAFTNELVQSL